MQREAGGVAAVGKGAREIGLNSPSVPRRRESSPLLAEQGQKYLSAADAALLDSRLRGNDGKVKNRIYHYDIPALFCYK